MNNNSKYFYFKILVCLLGVIRYVKIAKSQLTLNWPKREIWISYVHSNATSKQTRDNFEGFLGF